MSATALPVDAQEKVRSVQSVWVEVGADVVVNGADLQGKIRSYGASLHSAMPPPAAVQTYLHSRRLAVSLTLNLQAAYYCCLVRFTYVLHVAGPGPTWQSPRPRRSPISCVNATPVMPGPRPALQLLGPWKRCQAGAFIDALWMLHWTYQCLGCDRAGQRGNRGEAC